MLYMIFIVCDIIYSVQISNLYTEQIKYFNTAEGNEIFAARKD